MAVWYHTPLCGAEIRGSEVGGSAVRPSRFPQQNLNSGNKSSTLPKIAAVALAGESCAIMPWPFRRKLHRRMESATHPSMQDNP